MKNIIFKFVLVCILMICLTGCSNNRLKKQELIGTVWIDNNDYFHGKYEFYKADMAKMIAMDEYGHEEDYWDMVWMIENNILILSYTDGEIYNKYELNETKKQLISISQDEILTKIKE